MPQRTEVFQNLHGQAAGFMFLPAFLVSVPPHTNVLQSKFNSELWNISLYGIAVGTLARLTNRWEMSVELGQCRSRNNPCILPVDRATFLLRA